MSEYRGLFGEGGMINPRMMRIGCAGKRRAQSATFTAAGSYTVAHALTALASDLGEESEGRSPGGTRGGKAGAPGRRVDGVCNAREGGGMSSEKCWWREYIHVSIIVLNTERISR
jgi:hypothetical protein